MNIFGFTAEVFRISRSRYKGLTSDSHGSMYWVEKSDMHPLVRV